MSTGDFSQRDSRIKSMWQLSISGYKVSVQVVVVQLVWVGTSRVRVSHINVKGDTLILILLTFTLSTRKDYKSKIFVQTGSRWP